MKKWSAKDKSATQYRKFGRPGIEIISLHGGHNDQFPNETQEDFVDDYQREVENGPGLVGNPIQRQENE